MSESNDFTFMSDTAACCSNCCVKIVRCFDILISVLIECPCGCCYGCCQAREEQMVFDNRLFKNRRIDALGQPIFNIKITRYPGRWNSELCSFEFEKKSHYSMCVNDSNAFHWGLNVGSLFHPYRFARICRSCCCCCGGSLSAPVKQQMGEQADGAS